MSFGGRPKASDYYITLDFEALPCYPGSTMEVGTLVRRAPETRTGYRLHTDLGIIIEMALAHHCWVVWLQHPDTPWLTALDLLELV